MYQVENPGRHISGGSQPQQMDVDVVSIKRQVEMFTREGNAEASTRQPQGATDARRAVFVYEEEGVHTAGS